MLKVNKHLALFKLKSFVFQKADYLEVALREVQEITHVLNKCEIYLTALDAFYNPETFSAQVSAVHTATAVAGAQDTANVN